MTHVTMRPIFEGKSTVQVQSEPRHSITRELVLIGLVLVLGLLAALIIVLPAVVSG